MRTRIHLADEVSPALQGFKRQGKDKKGCEPKKNPPSHSPLKRSEGNPAP